MYVLHILIWPAQGTCITLDTTNSVEQKLLTILYFEHSQHWLPTYNTRMQQPTQAPVSDDTQETLNQ